MGIQSQAAFRILLLLPAAENNNSVLTLTRLTTGKGDQYKLIVNFSGQKVGIYNNAGKAWLKAEFYREFDQNDEATKKKEKAVKQAMLDASDRLHKFLMGRVAIPSG